MGLFQFLADFLFIGQLKGSCDSSSLDEKILKLSDLKKNVELFCINSTFHEESSSSKTGNFFSQNG